MNLTKTEKEQRKRDLIDYCNEHGISIPNKAGFETIENLIREFIDTAIVDDSDDELRLRQPDKPFNCYFGEFEIPCRFMIKATSKEVAAEWFNENYRGLLDDYKGIHVIHCTCDDFYEKHGITLCTDEE